MSVNKDAVGTAMDISKLEYELKAQVDFNELLLQTVPSAVYSIDNEQNIISWNYMAEKLTGYTAGEVIGHNISAFSFHPCTLDCDWYKTGCAISIANRSCKLKNKAGDTLYVIKNNEVLKNGNGETIGMIESFIDITERTIIERQLEESELRLSLATSNAKVGIWEWNVKTDEAIFNEQWAENIGYTPDELMPTTRGTWVRLTHPEDLKKALEAMVKHFAGETDCYECVQRIKHKNGEWIWVLDRGKVVEWDAENKPIRMIGTSIDITQRRQAEEKLEKNEKILAAVAMSIKELIGNPDYINAMAKCFGLIGHATTVDRVYLYVNRYDEEGKGYTSHLIEWNSSAGEPEFKSPDLQDMPFTAVDFFINPIIKGGVFQAMRSRMPKDKTREMMEARGIRSMIALPIFVRDIFWGFMGFDECKYEREWSEIEVSTLSAFIHSLEKTIERSMIVQELEASKHSAEAANLLKSQFLANMSHEIRTPLHAVLGFSTLLRDVTQDTTALKYLDAIQKAGNSLVSLIDDILDLSKIEAGKLELHNGFVDIRKMFAEMKDIFSLKLQEKKVVLHMEMDERIPGILFMDEMRTRQILLNLIGNAVKFTETGSIRVAARVEKQDPDRKKIDMVFEVQDTGIGIPEDQHRAIFDPFRQKDGQSNKKYGGTGLGLSISKRLIEMMGGTIALSSVPGEGTTFYAHIPEILIGKQIHPLQNANAPDMSPIELQSPSGNLSGRYFDDKKEAPIAMIRMLEQLKIDIWSECMHKNRIKDIRSLADLIVVIGNQFMYAEIIRYANTLSTYINSYNLQNIRSTLEYFPVLIDRMKEGYTSGEKEHDDGN